jgi:hypothetical protein
MEYYAVVYQMGKVASTSIVATLDEIENIEAVQSHFLGDKALKEMVSSLTNPEVSEYFFDHSLGQFVENVRITRKMNAARMGQPAGTRLLVISLSRDPVEWIRSSIVQDIEGYIPILKEIVAASGETAPDDEELVEKGLRLFLNTSCHILDQFGGIDALLTTPNAISYAFEKTVFRDITEARRMFLMLLRPADWFSGHYKVATGLDVATMKQVNGVLEHSEAHADFVVVRYEDFKKMLPAYLQRMGICDLTEFKSKNLTESKLFAENVARLFKSDIGQRLRSIYNRTGYAQTFGYNEESATPDGGDEQ